MRYVIAESLSGHKNGINEDAIRLTHSPAPMIAISDGHGGMAYDLSEVGAQVAVEVASDAMALFYQRLRHKALHDQWADTKRAPDTVINETISQKNDDPSTIWSEEIVTKMIEDWHKRIRAHSEQLGEVHRLERYGATLLAITYIAPYLFCFQLGDGHMGFINANGDWVLPVLEASHLRGEETYSLCDAHAWFRGQTYVAKLKRAPKAIFACTDGLEKAYPFGPYDFLTFIREASDLEDISPLMCEAVKYAHDDVTVGVIWLEKPIVDEGMKRYVRPMQEETSPLENSLSKGALLKNAVKTYQEKWALPDMHESKRLEILITLTYKNSWQTVAPEILARYHTLNVPRLRQQVHQTDDGDNLEKERENFFENQAIEPLKIEPQEEDKSDADRIYLMQLRYAATEEDGWYLKTSRGDLYLTLGCIIWGYDLGFEHGYALTPIGIVIKHPKTGRWGIKNISPLSWLALWQKTGAKKTVTAQDVIPLKNNLCLELYGLPHKVYWRGEILKQ